MKTPSGLLLLLFAGNVFAASLADVVAQLPTCALTCLKDGLLGGLCASTNQTCICLDPVFQLNVTTCVSATCTVKESLVAKNVTETSCGAPVRDRGHPYYALSISLGVISGAVVLLRFFTKFYTGAELGLDDYFIAITLAVGIPSSVLTVHGTLSNGLGRDIWTVTPTQITNFIHAFFAMEVLYFTQVSLLKMSLLFFYKRIFPAPRIQKLLWATVIFNAGFGVLFGFIAIFQCQPISFYWKNWDKEHKGSCLNANAIVWSNAAISILLDAWMLALPMFEVFHLQLHWKKKIGVAMMFVVGTFVTIVSIIRLQSLVHFSKSANPTWDNLSVSQWSTVEINIGIICACMPSLRILLVRLFPKLLGSTNQHSGAQYYANNKHSIHQSGGNISVGRPVKSLNSSQYDSNGDRITYSTTYTVEYGEHDEAKLVPMNDLNIRGLKSKSSSRVSENESERS